MEELLDRLPKKLNKKTISVVIPVKDEQDNIKPLYEQLIPVLSKLDDYEIIYIDDGSIDETSKRIKEINDINVHLIRFQRNFGKAAALSCGFSNSRGDIIITMDGDLQDDPKEIPRFLEMLEKYDVVSGWKFKRYDPISKTIPSKFFNWLSRKITGLNLHDSNCGFKAYRNYVVKDINLYGELHRYIPALAYWKGYNIGEIKVDHRPRIHGISKYGVGRLIKGFLDLITVKFLMNYINKPLHLFGSIGLISIFFGITICLLLFSEWLKGSRIGDRPLLMLGVLLIIMGFQFASLGLIGDLITSTKNNNNWIIKRI